MKEKEKKDSINDFLLQNLLRYFLSKCLRKWWGYVANNLKSHPYFLQRHRFQKPSFTTKRFKCRLLFISFTRCTWCSTGSCKGRPTLNTFNLVFEWIILRLLSRWYKRLLCCPIFSLYISYIYFQYSYVFLEII